MMGKEKPKIMFFIGNMSSSGGTERVLSVIAEGLFERSYEVFIVSLWGGGKPFFSLKEEIKIYWVEKERQRQGIRGNLQYLMKVLENEKPDVLVDVDTILGCYSLFLKIWRQNLCWVSWEHFAFNHHFRKNRLLRKGVRRIVSKYADHLVVLNDSDKRSYEEKLRPRCMVTRIYNPVPYKETFLKQKERKIIFAAGRLTKEKGFDLLIRSWKLLEEREPQWLMVVAGEGEDRKRLERIKSALGLRRLYFIGKVPDIETYYELAAFVVLPSRYEGFGMTLVEAMHYSLPVVSYACPTGPMEIVADGENGFLVDAGDVRMFSQRMKLLIENDRLRKRMGERAAETAGRFGRERILDEWEKVFGVEDISNCSCI